MTHGFDLDGFLPYQLAVLAGRVSREFAKEYETRFGLNRAEWRVMAHLSRAGAVSVREIHKRADMDKSRVSRAAARLEAAGIVEKHVNATDKRLVDLSLTPKGQDMMAELGKVADQFQQRLIERMGDGAPDMLSGIDKLLKGYDAT